ncbi:MAG: hypothetical protein JRH20_25150 [Deltaproteobacteria bacterium]|nr:hypothetical protein [Deltaproteobacteria bacterium]
MDIPCGPAEDGVFFLDGLFTEWKGVTAVEVATPQHIMQGRKSWNNAKDLSFRVMCNYSKRHLYLAVEVKDEYFVRTNKRKGDDHLRLSFGRGKARTLRVFPGDLKKIRGGAYWGRHKAKGIKMAEAMRRDGWAVELRLPMNRIPGYRVGQEAIHLNVAVADADWRAKVETVMATGRSRLVVAQVAADLSAFLKAMKASPKDIRMRKAADVVGGRRVEQVMWLRRAIGIVGEDLPSGGYFTFNLPAARAADIRWVRLMDLNGDRKQEIVTRYVQRGGGGRREVVAVYRFDDGNRFVRPFAHEVLKGQGSRTIVNRITFKKRRRGRGIEIIIDEPKAHGFDAQSYKETSAEDIHGIVLPWAEKEKQKRVFRFSGDEYEER